MRWFEGEVSTAINISKSQKTLFVVFVRGIEEDEVIWNEGSIGTIAETNKCICLKLKADSQLAREFSQIYPLIILPIVYFIGNDGQPLEVKVGRASVEELEKCFNRAIELHEKNISSGNGVTQAFFSNTFVEPLDYSSPNIEVQDFTVEETTKLIYDPFNESNDDKDIERRKVVGKKLDKEIKRHFKDDKEKRGLENELMKKKESGLTASDQTRKRIELDREYVRIQFKLPDGSIIINTFSSSDQLFRAQSFILQRLSNSCSGIKLTALHPKITFKDEDYGKTFMELNLTPSAVLIVLPKKPVPTSRSGNIFMYFFYQFLMLYHYLVSLILPSRVESTNTANDDSGSRYESSGIVASQSYGGARPKVFGTPNQSLRQRREGNIHRLTANDEDDEHATWNGNSTQQM